MKKSSKKLAVIALCLMVFFSMGLLACSQPDNVQELIDRIDNLSEITLSLEDELQSIRETYDALSDSDKNKVSNYDDFVAAETELNILKDINGLDLSFTSGGTVKTSEEYVPEITGYQYNEVISSVVYTVKARGTTDATLNDGKIISTAIGTYTVEATVSYAGHNIIRQIERTVTVNGYEISGTVILPEINSNLLSTARLTATGAIGSVNPATGAYSIGLAKGENTLLFSVRGFEDVQKQLTVSEDVKDNDVNFTQYAINSEAGSFVKQSDSSAVTVAPVEDNNAIRFTSFDGMTGDSWVMQTEVSAVLEGPEEEKVYGFNLFNGAYLLLLQFNKTNGFQICTLQTNSWKNIYAVQSPDTYKDDCLAPLGDGSVKLTAVRDGDNVYFWINDTFITSLSKGQQLDFGGGSNNGTVLDNMTGSGTFGFATRAGSGATFDNYFFSTDESVVKDNILFDASIELSAGTDNENGTAEFSTGVTAGKTTLESEVTVTITPTQSTETMIYAITSFKLNGGTISVADLDNNNDGSYSYTTIVDGDILFDIEIVATAVTAVSGTVSFSSEFYGTPDIEAATVKVGTNQFAVNSNGEWSGTVAAGSHDIVASHPDYMDVKLENVTITSDSIDIEFKYYGTTALGTGNYVLDLAEGRYTLNSTDKNGALMLNGFKADAGQNFVISVDILAMSEKSDSDNFKSGITMMAGDKLFSFLYCNEVNRLYAVENLYAVGGTQNTGLQHSIFSGTALQPGTAIGGDTLTITLMRYNNEIFYMVGQGLETKYIKLDLTTAYGQLILAAMTSDWTFGLGSLWGTRVATFGNVMFSTDESAFDGYGIVFDASIELSAGSNDENGTAEFSAGVTAGKTTLESEVTVTITPTQSTETMIYAITSFKLNGGTISVADLDNNGDGSYSYTTIVDGDILFDIEIVATAVTAVSGTVSFSSEFYGTPDIEAATVKVGTNQFAVNSNGEWSGTVAAGSHDIVASHPDYMDVKLENVTITSDSIDIEFKYYGTTALGTGNYVLDLAEGRYTLNSTDKNGALMLNGFKADAGQNFVISVDILAMSEKSDSDNFKSGITMMAGDKLFSFLYCNEVNRLYAVENLYAVGGTQNTGLQHSIFSGTALQPGTAIGGDTLTITLMRYNNEIFYMVGQGLETKYIKLDLTTAYGQLILAAMTSDWTFGLGSLWGTRVATFGNVMFSTDESVFDGYDILCDAAIQLSAGTDNENGTAEFSAGVTAGKTTLESEVTVTITPTQSTETMIYAITSFKLNGGTISVADLDNNNDGSYSYTTIVDGDILFDIEIVATAVTAVSGTVSFSSEFYGTPDIEAATVKVGTNQFAVNSNGEWSGTVAAGSHDIVASHPDYMDVKLENVTITSDSIDIEFKYYGTTALGTGNYVLDLAEGRYTLNSTDKNGALMLNGFKADAGQNFVISVDILAMSEKSDSDNFKSGITMMAGDKLFSFLYCNEVNRLYAVENLYAVGGTQNTGLQHSIFSGTALQPGTAIGGDTLTITLMRYNNEIFYMVGQGLETKYIKLDLTTAYGQLILAAMTSDWTFGLGSLWGTRVATFGNVMFSTDESAFDGYGIVFDASIELSAGSNDENGTAEFSAGVTAGKTTLESEVTVTITPTQSTETMIYAITSFKLNGGTISVADLDNNGDGSYSYTTIVDGDILFDIEIVATAVTAVSGTVSFSSEFYGTPDIEAATVKVGTNQFAVNSNGEWSGTVAAGLHDIVASHPDYMDVRLENVTITSDSIDIEFKYYGTTALGTGNYVLDLAEGRYTLNSTDKNGALMLNGFKADAGQNFVISVDILAMSEKSDSDNFKSGITMMAGDKLFSFLYCNEVNRLYAVENLYAVGGTQNTGLQHSIFSGTALQPGTAIGGDTLTITLMRYNNEIFYMVGQGLETKYIKLDLTTAYGQLILAAMTSDWTFGLGSLWGTRVATFGNVMFSTDAETVKGFVEFDAAIQLSAGTDNENGTAEFSAGVTAGKTTLGNEVTVTVTPSQSTETMIYDITSFKLNGEIISSSSLTDNKDGSYSYTVTASTTLAFEITIDCEEKTVVSGRIVLLEENRNLLTSARISSGSSSVYAAADGTFSLTVIRSADSLIVSIPGFKEKTVSMSLSGDSHDVGDISVTEYAFTASGGTWTEDNGTVTVGAVSTDTVMRYNFADITSESYMIKTTISNVQVDGETVFGINVFNNTNMLLFQYGGGDKEALRITALRTDAWSNVSFIDDAVAREKYNDMIWAATDGGSLEVTFIRSGEYFYLWLNGNFVGKQNTALSGFGGITGSGAFGLGTRANTGATYSDFGFSTDGDIIQSYIETNIVSDIEPDADGKVTTYFNKYQSIYLHEGATVVDNEDFVYSYDVEGFASTAVHSYGTAIKIGDMYYGLLFDFTINATTPTSRFYGSIDILLGLSQGGDLGGSTFAVFTTPDGTADNKLTLTLLRKDGVLYMIAQQGDRVVSQSPVGGLATLLSGANNLTWSLGTGGLWGTPTNEVTTSSHTFSTDSAAVDAAFANTTE